MSASKKPVFTHHRLEVYHLSLRMAALAKAVADSEPLHPARAANRGRLLVRERLNPLAA